MATFDPYRKWLGIPQKSRPPNHYRLLGIGLFESDPDVISNAADRQMAHVRTFQSGKHSELSQQILNELSAARICLLDAKKRAEYNAKLRATLKSSKPQPQPTDETQQASSLGDAAPTINVAPTIRGISPSTTTFSSAAVSLIYSTRRMKKKLQQWVVSVIVVSLVLGALILLIFVSSRSGMEQPKTKTPVQYKGKSYLEYFRTHDQPLDRPDSGGRRRSPNRIRPSILHTVTN